MAPRTGKHRALGAGGHSRLVLVYHGFARRTSYHELGGDYFARCQVARQRKQLIRKLEGLGLKGTVVEFSSSIVLPKQYFHRRSA